MKIVEKNSTLMLFILLVLAFLNYGNDDDMENHMSQIESNFNNLQ